MRIFLVLFLLLSSCSRAPSKLAICAIFKNEAPWLKEWIEYHHKTMKVFRFYLYNNDSSDHYKDVLKPYIETGLVELIDWESSDPSHSLEGDFMVDRLVPLQIGAYNECLKKRALHEADWVAMIDIDEFIVSLKGPDFFHDLLKKAKKQNKGSLSFQWRIFGTSHVKRLHEGEKLTQKLTKRASDDHPWHVQVKSIYRPETVDLCLAHVAKMKQGFGGKTISADHVRIHHYWTRTEEFCKERRGDVPKDFLEALNQKEDLSIQKS